MHKIRLREALVATVLLFLPTRADAALSGEFKSQKWPGSKIVFFEDGTAWYTPPKFPSVDTPTQAFELTYKDQELTVEGKKVRVIVLSTSAGSMVFLFNSGDLIRVGGDNDRFVKDSLWKRLTE